MNFNFFIYFFKFNKVSQPCACCFEICFLGACHLLATALAHFSPISTRVHFVSPFRKFRCLEFSSLWTSGSLHFVCRSARPLILGFGAAAPLKFGLTYLYLSQNSFRASLLFVHEIPLTKL